MSFIFSFPVAGTPFGVADHMTSFRFQYLIGILKEYEYSIVKD
jgi:hypothetical protein